MKVCANPKCGKELELSPKQKQRNPKHGNTCSKSCSGYLGKIMQMRYYKNRG